MGNKVLLLAVSIILALPCMAQDNFTRAEYIDKYKDIAIRQMKSHGIPASIILAQGCLESSNGNSTLAVKANNHFGIKCHSDWNGPTIRQDDDERGECFRKYKKAEASFKDHSDFLRYRDRYAFLFELEITDYKGWCYGLKKAGYATHPQYAENLIKIIEDNKLYQYDRQGGRNKQFLPPSPATLEELAQLKPTKNSPLYKYSRNRTIYVKNKVAYIISNENDTYETIADEYNLFTYEVLRFNDLKRGQTLRQGTVVYIQNKKKKAGKHLDIHIAEKGDTYYDISQRYAVRLSSILKYNNARKGDNPREGEEVLLRKPR